MVCPSRGANLRARRSATLQRPGMGFLSNLRTTAFDLDTALQTLMLTWVVHPGSPVNSLFAIPQKAPPRTGAQSPRRM